MSTWVLVLIGFVGGKAFEVHFEEKFPTSQACLVAAMKLQTSPRAIPNVHHVFCQQDFEVQAGP